MALYTEQAPRLAESDGAALPERGPLLPQLTGGGESSLPPRLCLYLSQSSLSHRTPLCLPTALSVSPSLCLYTSHSSASLSDDLSPPLPLSVSLTTLTPSQSFSRSLPVSLLILPSFLSGGGLGEESTVLLIILHLGSNTCRTIVHL